MKRGLLIAAVMLLVVSLLAVGCPAPAPPPAPPPVPPTPAPTPTPGPTPMPAPEPQKFSGRGQQVSPKLRLDAGISVFHMSHDGKSNFAVWLLADDGSRVDLLVNTIGAFTGSKAVGVKKGAIIGAKPGIHILDIAADGNWAITLEQ